MNLNNFIDVKDIDKEKGNLNRDFNIKTMFDRKTRIDICTEHIIKNKKDIKYKVNFFKDLKINKYLISE